MSNRYNMLRLSSQSPRVSRIRQFGNGICLGLLLLSMPITLGIVSYAAWKNYELWQHGIEKSVFVKALDHTTRAPKAGTTFHYRIEMDGREFIHDFRVPLPVGHRVTMLTLADDPDELIPGNQDSTLFEILSATMGGKGFAILTIIVFPIIIFGVPHFLLTLKRSWRIMINR